MVFPDSTSFPRVPGDGAITTRPGLAVGVVTADCVPVLLANPAGDVVAAVHAGWRGLAAGVVEAALQALEGWATAGTLVAALGPSARGCCYEVGPEVVEAVRPESRRVVPSREGRFLLDLAGAVEDRLAAAGVAADRIVRTGPCTICSEDWPSYRRQGAQAGRLLAWIRRCETGGKS